MSGLDYPTVARLVRRWTYKPNVEVEVTPDTSPHGIATVHVTMYVPDSRSRRPHPAVEVDRGFDDPFYGDRYSVMRSLLSRERYRQNLDLMPVQGSRPVPPGLPNDEQTFYKWLRRLIGELEDHEIDEWFRVDGELFNDPHANDEARRAV